MGKHDKIAARFAGKETDSPWHPCYLEYFQLFNAREYYAAHDVLEHIWLGSDGERYVFYKALIQFAGGFVHLQHHHREPEHRIHGKRLRPAARLFRRSAELLGEIPPTYEGIAIEEVVVMALSSADALESADFAHNPWHPDRAPQLRGPTLL
jgi:predicted metal-dependent hydrolase